MALLKGYIPSEPLIGLSHGCPVMKYWILKLWELGLGPLAIPGPWKVEFKLVMQVCPVGVF